MKLINASYEYLEEMNESFYQKALTKVEFAGRTCYKSHENMTPESAEKFVRMIIKRGHESVLEHVSFSVRFIVDRGVSHELVRHRIASFSQESTRYCNYSNEKFGNELTFIKPLFFKQDSTNYKIWTMACNYAENHYVAMLAVGATPQEARSVLPNSLKTEVVMTANIREWRHFLKLRTSKAAHPQMREVAVPMLQDLQDIMPVFFEDINF